MGFGELGGFCLFWGFLPSLSNLAVSLSWSETSSFS